MKQRKRKVTSLDEVIAWHQSESTPRRTGRHFDPAGVVRAKVVRQVIVEGEKRPVFYTHRDMIFDKRGLPCLTPLEMGAAITESINRRDVANVESLLWDVLSFVHNGKVPKDWHKEHEKRGATPLAV